MIYTIGHARNYLEAYNSEDKTKFKKLGYRAELHGKEYRGGAMFKTQEEAEAWIEKHGYLGKYAPFGVIADWDRDTKYYEGDDYNSLQVDSQIVLIEGYDYDRFLHEKAS